MKKECLCLFLIFLFSGFIYSEEVGKLLKRTESADKVTELRVFEIKNFKAGDYLKDIDTVYDDYINKNVIGKLKWYEEKIDISRIYTVHYLEKKINGDKMLENSGLKFHQNPSMVGSVIIQIILETFLVMITISI